MGVPEIFALMAARRTIRRYTPRPVEMDKLLQIVQAGSLAPSAGNLQNWSFVVITDVDRIRGMYPHTLDQEPFLSAMAAIIVCGDQHYAHTMYGMRGKRLYTIQNCAAAAQNMLLAATALGLGSTWVGAFDEDKISDMFGIPSEKHRPQAILLFGYPDSPLEPKKMKLLDNMTFYNGFGSRVKKPHLIYYDWATEWQNMAKTMRMYVTWFKHEANKRKEGNGEQDTEQNAGDGTGAGSEQQKPDRIAELKKMSKESTEQVRSSIKDALKNLKKPGYK